MDNQKFMDILTELNIDLIGSFSVDTFNPENRFIKEMIAKNQLSDFSNGDVSERINPKTLLKSCTHVLVMGLSYALSSKNPILGYGHLSAQGVGIDYHITLTDKLKMLAQDLKKEINDFEYRVCVDTTPLSDRDIAYAAGLGFFGKNNFIISKEYGTAFNIGYLLINKEIPKLGKGVELSCGSCKKCIDACPGGALNEKGLNTNRCISELTQRKNILSYEERGLIGVNIYGCDICQRVCPFNHKNELLTSKECSIDLIKLAQMSNKSFHDAFKNRGFHWRGNGVIKRNAIIAMGNIGDEKFVRVLKPLLEHPSQNIRIYALWALYKIKPLQITSYNLKDERLIKEVDRLKAYYE